MSGMKLPQPAAHSLLLSAAAMLITMFCSGCTDGQAGLQPDAAKFTPDASVVLPAPSQFSPRAAAASGLQQDGSAYVDELPNQFVSRITNRGYFSPEGWGAAETAFAVYSFDLSGRSGAEVLLFDWVREWAFTAVPANFWVGLSLWQLDSWAWYAVADVGQLPIDDISPFISPADGSCHVLLLFGGADDDPDLKSIAIGEEPVINAIVPINVQSGVEADMMADVTGSEPLSYVWDFSTCAFPGYSYDAVPRITPGLPGTFACQLTITNPMGSDTLGFPLEIAPATGEWVHTLGNVAYNYAIACISDAEDNLLLLDGSGLHKITPSGNLEWSYSYFLSPPVDSSQSYCDLIVDSNGAFYISGTYGGDLINRDGLFVIKVDSSGNAVWQKTWAGQPNNNGCRLALDSEDNIFLSGSTRSTGQGGDDLLLLKFSSAGQMLKQTAWGSSDSEWGEDIAIDTHDNVYVSGYIHYIDPPEDFESVLLKFDSAGTLLSEKGIEGANTTRLLVNHSNDHVYMLLKYGKYSAVLEFNESGVVQWSKNYVHDASSYLLALLLGEDGALYLCGLFWNSELFDKPDCQLLKCNLAGELTWCKWWDNNEDEERLDALAIGPDGSLYLAGAATNAGGSWQDVTDDITVTDYLRTVRSLSGTLSTPVLELSDAECTRYDIDYTLDLGGGNRDTLCFRYQPE